MATYRVQQKCTIRSAADSRAPIIARLGSTTEDGKPRLITGCPALPGWVEWIEGAITMGYVKAGALREVQRAKAVSE
jgi:hypothetical protein